VQLCDFSLGKSLLHVNNGQHLSRSFDTTKIVIGRDIWFGICREPIQFYGALLFVTQQQET